MSAAVPSLASFMLPTMGMQSVLTFSPVAASSSPSPSASLSSAVGAAPPSPSCSSSSSSSSSSTSSSSSPSVALVSVPRPFPFQNPEDRRRCLIIYTGGTIGMVRSPKDGALRPASGELHRILDSFPELSHPDLPIYSVLEWSRPIDSSDFSPALWILLAKQIETHYFSYDGFCILHGTDTMAYTASALSFMLENCNKTVVLTGSMIPLSEPVSDAKRNLIISLISSVHLDIPEVVIFFDNVLLRGNRAKKLDPGTMNAFSSPNLLPLAEMGVHITVRREIILPAPRRRFICHTQLFSNISVMFMIPGFDDDAIVAFANSSVPSSGRGVAICLALYGTGNAPAHKQSFIEAIRYAIEVKEAVIVIVSQCLRGGVDMRQYETGSILHRLGVIDGRDMTIESAVTKLAYAMGRGWRGRKLKEVMENSIRGELTDFKTDPYAQTREYVDFTATVDQPANSIPANAESDSSNSMAALSAPPNPPPARRSGIVTFENLSSDPSAAEQLISLEKIPIESEIVKKISRKKKKAVEDKDNRKEDELQEKGRIASKL